MEKGLGKGYDIRALAKKVARGEPVEEVGVPSGLSGDTVRILQMSDAFRALVREETLKGGPDA